MELLEERPPSPPPTAAGGGRDGNRDELFERRSGNLQERVDDTDQDGRVPGARRN